MQRALILILVIVFIFLAFSGVAQDTGHPFSVGERFRFFIYAGKLYVGYQTVDLVSIDSIGGKEYYKIKGLSRSSFFLSIIYRLDDKWTVYIDKETLLPMKVEKDMVEGRSEGFFVYDMDQNNRKLSILDKNSGKVDVVNGEHDIFDLFSLLYYYRNNPHIFNSPFTFDFMEPHALQTVHFQEEGVVDIIIPRISKKRTVSARKVMQIGGIGIEMYVSNDSLRVPLKMTVPSILPGDKKLLIEFYIDRFEPGVQQGKLPDKYKSLTYK
ncbi:MAG: DUF3108 domain-containing protein [Spirochaetota bacterium]|nr:MAG: DUF3108 domain-containing protein [Spirochaetota bacterium]